MRSSSSANRAAAKFDQTIRCLARYLAATTIKETMAYTPLLEAMEDPVWEEPVRPTKTKQVSKESADTDRNKKTKMEEVVVNEANYKVDLDLYVHYVKQLWLHKRAHAECDVKA